MMSELYNRKCEMPVMTSEMGKFRAIQFNFRKDNTVGWKETIKILWGFDIWMGNTPIVKVLILANVIVWLILFRKV